MSESLPRGENEFFVQQDIIMDAIVKNMVLWGLNQARVHDVLQVQQAKYVAARNDCLNPQTTTRDMINHRNKMRKEYETELRVDVGGLKNNPAVTEEWLDRLNIAHGRGGPTHNPPEDSPFVKVFRGIATRLKFFICNVKTKKLGKPVGAEGSHVRIGILGLDPNDHEFDQFRMDAVPVNPEDLPYWVYLSDGKLELEFKKQHSGLRLVISACWVNTKGKRSPWSEILIVIIP
jgi:hypothetical protein